MSYCSRRIVKQFFIEYNQALSKFQLILTNNYDVLTLFFTNNKMIKPRIPTNADVSPMLGIMEAGCDSLLDFHIINRCNFRGRKRLFKQFLSLGHAL